MKRKQIVLATNMTEERHEITNEVLAEQIKGLTKLTDERFLGLKESLVRIETINSGYATKVELEEVKKDFNKTIEQIRQDFAQHNIDDKKSFEILEKGQRDLSDTIKTWVGGLAVIAILLPIAATLILHYAFHI